MNLHLKWLLKAGVAAAFLGCLFWRADLVSLWRLLAGQSPGDLVQMMVILLLGIAVGTYKWRLLLPAESFRRLFRLNMAAIFYSLIVPGQVGAEVIKAYQLGRGRIDAETIAASVVLDKITGLLSLLVLGVAGTLLTALPLGQGLRLSLAALFVGGMAMLFGLRIRRLRALASGCIDRLHWSLPRMERPARMMMLFLDAWCGYLDRPGRLCYSLAAGVLQQAIYIGMIVLLSHQLGFDLAVFEWCWIFSLASLAAILPISLAGLGVREGIFVWLLGAFAIPAEPALALSLTIFALQVVIGCAGGALELLRLVRRA